MQQTKYPLTKYVQHKLKEVALGMVTVRDGEPDMHLTHEKHIMTKEALEEMGYAEAEKLQDGTYLYKAPVFIAVNYYRGLKKAYIAGGISNVKKYVERMNNYQ